MSDAPTTADRLSTVDDWVEYIQSLHVREIELDLGRTKQVYERLVPQGLRSRIISVAGTNGKGSTAQLLNHVYLSAGYSVGKYTSPHLLRFNERIQIDGNDVKNIELIGAFKTVETARQDTPLTFFEFGTLVAIELFRQADVDVMIMEVGLGGRLDAVNILNCDLAIITSISIDHSAWLGNTVEQIAFEKAGIVRSAKPVVIGETRYDKLVQESCRMRGAICYQLGVNFAYNDLYGEQGDDKTEGNTVDLRWDWRGTDAPEDTFSAASNHIHIKGIPLPFKQQGVQLNNAACAVQAVTLLQQFLPVLPQAIRDGISAAHMRGRCQVVSYEPTVLLDVAHNEDSINVLNSFLKALQVKGKLIAVCGMLRDKELAQSLTQIAPSIDVWCIGSIKGDRGSPASHIAKIVEGFYLEGSCGKSLQHAKRLVDSNIEMVGNGSIQQYESIDSAFDAALSNAQADDCIVVFGSFYVVADILARLS